MTTANPSDFRLGSFHKSLPLVRAAFERHNSEKSRQEVADTWDITLPKSHRILHQSICWGALDGYAFVLYADEDGHLFEVNDYHDSCFGFENWEPEPTFPEALRRRIHAGWACGADGCFGCFGAELLAVLNEIDPPQDPKEAAREEARKRVVDVEKVLKGQHLVLDVGGMKVALEARMIPKVKKAIEDWEALHAE